MKKTSNNRYEVFENSQGLKFVNKDIVIYIEGISSKINLTVGGIGGTGIKR